MGFHWAQRWAVVGRALALIAFGCGPPPEPPPPGPPQVYVVAAESNVVGSGFRIFVTVTGCTTVKQVDILHNNAFMRAVAYTANPTPVDLTTADFVMAYPQVGIAADLALTARAQCDDDRIGTSQPVGVRFFPVASVTPGINGASALPDSFYAEGGINGVQTSYVGCVGTETGYMLARVNGYGQIIQTNSSALPFPCSYDSFFTEKNPFTGKRWMLEPGKGAIAIDSNLNITSNINGTYTTLTQAPDGDAIVWDNKTSVLATLKRVSHEGAVVKWEAAPKGIMNAAPVVNLALNTVIISMWDNALGTTGTVRTMRYNYTTGAFTGQNTLTTMSFEVLDVPEIPNGQMNEDGSVIYFPYKAQGPQATKTKSGVYACATNTDNCTGASLRWASPLFDGVATNVVLSTSAGYLAALTQNEVWFLRLSDGGILNASVHGIKASGNLVLHGVQPGLAGDFYVLTGPAGDQFTRYFPMEIIAVDNPNSGEVWRYSLGAPPQSPLAGITVAIDEAGTSWLRIGLRQVKPLSLSEYRNTRGPTP